MVTSEIKKYVQEKNIEKIRKELLAILNSNPDMGDGQFKENLNYALHNLGKENVYVSYSGEFEIKNNKEEWNTAYVARIYLQLRKEFSEELIMHLMNVAPVAYKDKIEQRDILQQTTHEIRALPYEKKEDGSLRVVCEMLVKCGLVAVIIIILAVIVINIV